MRSSVRFDKIAGSDFHSYHPWYSPSAAKLCKTTSCRFVDERSSARRASGRTPLAILLRPPQLNLLSAGFFVFRIPAKKTFGTRHAAVQKRSRRFCVSKIQLNRSAMWTQADENLLSPRRARRVQSARRQTVGVLRSRFHGSTKSSGTIFTRTIPGTRLRQLSCAKRRPVVLWTRSARSRRDVCQDGKRNPPAAKFAFLQLLFRLANPKPQTPKPPVLRHNNLQAKLRAL